ncbi:MAG: hypothetical protein V9G19_03555 [Tetrasphaera sp.]
MAPLAVGGTHRDERLCRCLRLAGPARVLSALSRRGAAGFPAYHAQYNRTITWVVVVPGFVTFLAQTGFWWTRPAGTPRGLAAVVAAGGLSAIASTVLWAIPRHDRLDRIGRDAATIDSLLQANRAAHGRAERRGARLCFRLGPQPSLTVSLRKIPRPCG